MNETLALMSRDDADELLVAQLGVFLLAAKHSETKADEAIIQAAIDQRAVRLYLLSALGFDDYEALQFSSHAPMPIFEGVGSALELIAFLKKYGPQIKAAIEAIVAIINAFKGIAPSVPEVGDVPSVPRKPNF